MSSNDSQTVNEMSDVSLDRRSSLRSRQVTALRQEIVAAAMDLFLTNGFEETTVEEIADCVGISGRTIFRHYPGKEDIVLSGSFEAAERLRAKVACCPLDEAPMDCIHRAYIHFVEEPEGGQGLPIALARLVAKTPKLHARALQMTLHWENAIVEGLVERDPRTVASAPLIAAVAVSVVRIATRRWLASDGNLAIARCVDEAFVSLRDVDLSVRGRVLPD